MSDDYLVTRYDSGLGLPWVTQDALQRALEEVMAEISVIVCDAQWMGHDDYHIWAMVVGDTASRGSADDGGLEPLVVTCRVLSEMSGSWIRDPSPPFDGSRYAVNLVDWQAHYDEWRTA